jgi:hypothetical protein
MNNTTKLGFLVIFASSLFVATPAMAGYGSNPPGPPVCNNAKPGTPSFSFVRNAGGGQIEVGWNMVDRANGWTIAYGVDSGKYIYGMANFGNDQSRSVKINMLPVGIYYFVIKANNGCMPGSFSGERKVTVYANGNVLGAKTTKPWTLGSILGVKTTPTPEATMAPTATSTVEPSRAPIEEIITPPATQQPNWFQRLINWLFHR